MRKALTCWWLAGAVLGAGCESDPPVSYGLPTDLDRETPSNLVSRYLPWTVAARDSAALAGSIADAFSFRALSAEGDGLESTPAADKAAVLAYLGRALAGHADETGRTIDQANLVITERGIFRDTATDAARPEDETWYKADLRIDLVISFHDPAAEGGRSTDRYAASVYLWIGPDPADTDLWVIERAEEAVLP